ncbi:MAG: twin transmembrane helix small protein [Rhodospirillales bacterium]|jgi:hypothetical protein|nr:twin transmembrane helix small protein [Rhodospirillales bacterium]|tara:strand:+ start:675 stop:866 length:192 start_codon:yes stop_codon:yes gene_type:complete
MGFIEAILVLILVAVVVILVAGLFGFANPGDTSEERRNRLMRLRVIAQAVAVGLLAVLVYLTR